MRAGVGIISSGHKVPAGGLIYSDDFNRANTTPTSAGGAGLGAQWIAPEWSISSNQAARGSTGSDDFAIFQHDLGTHDIWAEADVTPNGQYGVVNVRNEQAVHNCYLGFWSPGGFFEIGMQIGGTYTTVATGGSAGGFTTKKIRLEAQGTTLRLYGDNVLQVTGTNTVLSSSGAPNNRYAGLNSNQGPTVDNYRCGALPWTP